MKPKHWLVFILLGAIWSTSFLWIKIAVQEVGPFTLAAVRVLFGSLTLVIALAVTRTPLPRDPRTWLVFAVIGLTSVVVPFVLIPWGEQTIDSAVAAILNATVPLFTIVIAHLFLHDDRITPLRLAGLALGFVGVGILLSEDLLASSHSPVLGQLAVLVASLFYAGSAVYARRKTRDLPGMVRGSLPLLTATVMMWAIAPLAEAPFRLPALPITWLAVVWLGVLGTGLAQVLWYYLLHEIGPTRTGMVTYLFPLGGMILGVVFLNEHFSWQLLAGAALIIASLLVVNRSRA
jgi:drug/metabolite transporter (DMT)-like permease